MWDSTKKNIGHFCSQQVQNNTIVGLGSGSTSEAFIRALGERAIKESLDISCIASSARSEQLARECKLPLVEENHWEGVVSVMFDGADAVDTRGNAIKGLGGALVREKILAHASEKVVIMVDERKWRLSWKKCPLPVAIVPFGVKATLTALSALGCKGAVRMKNCAPFATDDGLWIVDLSVEHLKYSQAILDKKLKSIPGVVETGLFPKIATSIVVGYADGTVERHLP